MKTLEQNIFKVLTDSINVTEFERIIYQEYYVDKMESNEFIAKIIKINYRDENWKNELEKLAFSLLGNAKYLTYLIRNYCLQIIESNDLEKVFNIVSELARLNSEHDYIYGTLMQFYQFVNELDLISCGYGNCTKEELLLEIKFYAKSYFNVFDLNTDSEKLLNLKEDFIQNQELRDKENLSDFSKKINENKKWFHFWK